MSSDDFERWTHEEITRLVTSTSLRRPSDHQSMFKYISLDSEQSWIYFEKTLNSSKLTGRAASFLNDPFELSPSIFNDLHPSVIAAATRYNDLAERLSDKPKKPLEEIFPDPEPYRVQAENYIKSVAERFRIIAFCERPDSGLLWSHYADSYRGACLHFLGKGFKSFHYTLGYVNYSKYRPTYPLSLALSLSSKPGGPPVAINSSPFKRAESSKLLFFTKAEEWAYESEIRLVYDSKDFDAPRFEKDSLVSVILGPLICEKKRQRIVNLVRNSPYKNISVRQASLSKTTFSVEIGGANRC